MMEVIPANKQTNKRREISEGKKEQTETINRRGQHLSVTTGADEVIIIIIIIAIINITIIIIINITIIIIAIIIIAIIIIIIMGDMKEFFGQACLIGSLDMSGEPSLRSLCEH